MWLVVASREAAKPRTTAVVSRKKQLRKGDITLISNQEIWYSYYLCFLHLLRCQKNIRARPALVQLTALDLAWLIV